MVAIDVAWNPKLQDLSTSERWAHVAGVLALAAKSPEPGVLLVRDRSATAKDVAHQARVRIDVAERCMQKLRAVGIIYETATDHLAIHDWDDWNPQPAKDRTISDRQRRFRERKKQECNGDVTEGSKEKLSKFKGKENHLTPLSSKLDDDIAVVCGNDLGNTEGLNLIAQRCFEYWQVRCDHPRAKFTDDRQKKVRARLGDGYTEADIRIAIDGAAENPFINDDDVTFDDLELICRSGSKLESFIERARCNPATAVVAASDDDPTEGKTSEDHTVIAQRLFGFWRCQCGYPMETEFTVAQQRAVLARLGEGFTETDIRTAIAGVQENPFLDEDGTWHDDLELICRSSEQLERGIKDGIYSCEQGIHKGWGGDGTGGAE